MIGNWRSPLDKNLVVGIVFDDVRKAFDSISHHVLLNKSQAVGFADDLWCWIEDYLDDRSQASVVNGFQSETLPVKFGVPQVVLQRSAWYSWGLWWRNSYLCWQHQALRFTWLRLLPIWLFLPWTSSFRSCMTGASLTASYPPRRTEYMMSVHPVKSTRCLGNEINSDLN